MPGYTEKMRQEMIKEIHKYNATAAVYEGENNEMLFEQAELIITTHELNCSKKQLFIPMLPKAGRKGVTDTITEIHRSLGSKKENGGIVYV